MRREQSGFTIIEVLIVLAIAGLIMVVVFLAVPNLQKSQRNNARDTDANNLLQSVSSYIGNANGTLPADCSSAAGTCTWITYKPQQLTTYSMLTTSVAGGSDAIPAAPSNSTGYLIAGAICSGLSPTKTGAGPRDYVVYYGIEGSTLTKCTQGS